MKNTWSAATFIVGVMILGVLVYIAFVKPNEEKKYIYDIEFYKDGQSHDALIKLGQKGWEVVGSRRARDDYDDYGYEFIFKKEALYEEETEPQSY